MKRQDLLRLSQRAEEWKAHLVHQLQLMRLRAERLIAGMPGRGARPSVIATACWHFPIWSQTFVYQELTQLIRRGVDVRFLYSELNPREYLPSQFSPLWRDRRKLILHPSVCKRDYAYFARRMPGKIDGLVGMLCEASGMSPQELRSHHHFLQAFSFTRMVEAYRPDYLHSYFFYEGTLFAFIASYLLDIPRGVSCYADHVLKDYVLKVVPLHLGQCSLAIATSHRIKRELMSLAPDVDPDRIIVKPNGINPDAFPVMHRSDPEGEQPYRLISVSRIEPKKGLLYLMEAVRQLRDQGLNVELHVLGEVDGSVSSKEYARALELKIRELGIEIFVHLEGRKSEGEINQFFKNSHLFVAPFVEMESGDKDGIPTSLLEAMSSGLPVVATDAGSIPEVIEDGRDGVMVPQRDPAALAKAIERLLRDPDGRRRLGREAAEKIRRCFDVGDCEKKFHEEVRAVIEDRRENIRPLPGRTCSERAIGDERERSLHSSVGSKPMNPPPKPWKASTLPSEIIRMRSMLSHEEKQYLVWLTAEKFEGWGAIVDLGPWLGSSSAALAEGLKRRGRPDKVHSFDLFKWERSYMEALVHEDLSDGEDFLPLFIREVGDYAVRIEPRREDLMRYRWDGGPIEILFVDAAKTWELTNAILRGFGDHLVPGQSRVVLQDFRYHRTHWLPLILDSRPDLWQEIESVEDGTTVTFIPLKPLHGPVGINSEYSEEAFPLRSAEHLLRSRMARETPWNRHLFLRTLYKKCLIEGALDKAQAVRKELLADGARREIKWSLRIVGGSVAKRVFPPDDPDGVRIAIEKADTKTGFDIQLNQPHLKVKSNQRYNLYFRARADSPRSIFLGFAQAHEPWTGLGLYSKIELTSEWHSFQEDFVATADDDNARIHFDVGGSDISIELSSVSLRSLPDGRPIEPSLGVLLTEDGDSAHQYSR